MKEFQPTGPLAWDPAAILAGFWDDEEDDDEPGVVNGVLRISIRGGLCESSWWGTCYSSLRHELERARGIIGLRAVVLEIDSPGGEVSGCQETVAAIEATDAVVPVYAYVRGTCASAAYWLAAACRRIVAVQTTRIGCVGAICSLVDTRGIGEKLGAKYYRFTSDRTPNKSPEPGTEALATETQAVVDAIGDAFLSDLSRTRGPRGDLDAVAEHYQGGRMLSAPDALAAGWVDAVLTSAPSGRDAWLMTGEAPPSAKPAATPFNLFPMVRRAAAATTEEASMANENNGGGVVTLTAEAYAELSAQVASLTERAGAAESALAAERQKVATAETERNSASARNVALEANVKILMAKDQERDIRDAINAAVDVGKVAPGDVARFQAIAAEKGADVLNTVLAHLPVGAAGPKAALTSGRAMPSDPPDPVALAKAQAQAEINAVLGKDA